MPEIATALVALATAAPVGMAEELARIERGVDGLYQRRLTRARGQRRWVLLVRPPGAAGRAMGDGAPLPTGPWSARRRDFRAVAGAELSNSSVPLAGVH